MAKDVQMGYIESDIRKIQIKTNMYLQSYGKGGAFHLFKEVAQNGFDEISDDDSNGNEMLIRIDTLEDSAYVEDNGRGFPENDFPLDIFCTKLQSGSKFNRDSGAKTAGEFGVGLTAVNALSTVFTVKSYREKENKLHILKFEEGVKVEDTIESLKGSKKKHGTQIKFIPSKKFLGPTTCLPYEDIVTWLEDLQFNMNKGLRIILEKYEGLKLIEKKVLTAKDDIGLIDKISSGKYIIKPFKFVRNDKFDEEVITTEANAKFNKDDPKSEPYLVKKKIVSRDVDYTLVLGYDDNPECIYDSYCNFTNTTDGGVHIDSAEDAVCRYLQKSTKASLSDKEKEKIDILWSDVRSNLKMVVKLSTDADVNFIGNAKQKIGSESLPPIIKAGLTDELTKYFEGPGSDTLKAITKFIKINAKARIEANKVRTASVKETMDNFKEYELKNYTPANDKGKNDYREIFLVEGDSAKGSGESGRFPGSQAFFALRGVTANAFKATLAELMHPVTGNAELRNLVKVLRCGIGKDFDISKLYFKKIIIMTDADIDGAGITAGLCGFFIKYMPELVEQGYIYKVVSPLYKLKGVKNPFVHSKEEMIGLYQDDIIKNYKVKILALGDEVLSKNDFREFIRDTSGYQEELVRISKHFGVNKFLIERITSYLVYAIPGITSDFDPQLVMSDQKFVTNLMDVLQQRFNEIKLVGSHSIRGIIEGRYQTVDINRRFIKKVSRLFSIYKEYGYSMIVSEKGNEPYQASIGKFLDDTNKYVPTIDTRYKGLGEMDPDELRETTLDPNNRLLIRLTCEEASKELDRFQMLFGTRGKDLDARKKMMSEYEIKPEDLDN